MRLGERVLGAGRVEQGILRGGKRGRARRDAYIDPPLPYSSLQ